MKRLLKICILSFFLVLIPRPAYAGTEYPWTGSEKDAERSGGLGWITVKESLVLPGTKECSVTILQAGDERWGHMAGEEDPDEFLWTITLYEKDGFTARIQLPYSTYRTYCIGKSAIPNEYAENLPDSTKIEWFPVNDLMLNESGRKIPADISSSCRLSPENPEGKLCNDLIMTAENENGFSYDEDISGLFTEHKSEKESLSSVSPKREGLKNSSPGRSFAFCITGICSLVISATLLMLRRRRHVPLFCIAFFAITGILLLII